MSGSWSQTWGRNRPCSVPVFRIRPSFFGVIFSRSSFGVWWGMRIGGVRMDISIMRLFSSSFVTFGNLGSYRAADVAASVIALYSGYIGSVKPMQPRRSRVGWVWKVTKMPYFLLSHSSVLSIFWSFPDKRDSRYFLASFTRYSPCSFVSLSCDVMYIPLGVLWSFLPFFFCGCVVIYVLVGFFGF